MSKRVVPVALGVAVVLGAYGQGGCSRKEREPTPAPPPVQPPLQAPVACEPMPFAIDTPLPEASGAAWLELDSKLSLVVVSDSGHGGAFAVLDPETGVTRLQGKLPLGKGASDDIEGLSERDGKLVGLTSAGMVRVWTWSSGAFQLVEGPYPIGEGENVCSDHSENNCGRDYEGLAIAPKPPAGEGACIGFACARGDGALYCITDEGGRLQIDPTRHISVDRKMVLADCAFSDANTLFTGNNVFGMSTIHRIDGWQDPASARVVQVGEYGIGFPEVIAVRGNLLYRLSDTGGTASSLMAKFRCSASTR